jgi:hypothetical protein
LDDDLTPALDLPEIDPGDLRHIRAAFDEDATVAHYKGVIELDAAIRKTNRSDPIKSAGLLQLRQLRVTSLINDMENGSIRSLDDAKDGVRLIRATWEQFNIKLVGLEGKGIKQDAFVAKIREEFERITGTLTLLN